MPFDGNSAKFAKSDVFSLAGLVAWLETQPAETAYNFWNCHGQCLLSTYLTVRGMVEDSPGTNYIKLMRATCGYGVGGDPIDVSGDKPWTYGAALARARALLG
jgi:hypothetical protein